MTSVEKRLEIIEAELAAIKKQLQSVRSGVVGRTSPDFLDTMFGIHAKSSAFPELVREIERVRESEREEALSVSSDDKVA